MKNHKQAQKLTKGGVMKNLKLLGVAGIFIFLFLAGLLGNVYSCVGDECKKDSNIGDINDGNKGYIFTYYCEKGNESLGKWVDPTSIPELKGEKGDTGEQGIQGEQGIAGINGLNGLDGQNGIDGLNGIDGINGLNGLDGLKGDTGEQGIAGIDGLNGIDGINGLDGLNGEKGDTGEQGIQGFTGEQGIQGIQGIQGLIGNIGNTGEQGIQGVQGVQGKTGVKGDKGDKGDRGLRGKGLKDQYKAGVGLRIFDTRKTQGEIAYYRDFNNNANEIVAKITIKLGASFEEKEIAKTNNRLDNLETYLSTPEVKEAIEQVKMKNIKVKTNGKSFWLEKGF
jgi:hypothetical protein